MSIRIIRFFLLGTLLMGLTGVAACGSDSDNRDSTLEVECEGRWDCSSDQMCLDGKCVADTTPWCDTKYDCQAGEICQGGICAAEGDSCTNDRTCAQGRICTEGKCVDGCRQTGECSGGQACLADNTCGACEADSQCSTGDVCEEGSCITPALGQCQGYAAGRSCDPDALTASGFKCADLGRGPVCVASCVGVARGEQDPCQAGSFCDASAGAEGVCVLSECKNPLDIAGCADKVAADPETFSDGADCVHRGNQAFTCQPSKGTRPEGGSCSAFTRCASGLACGPSGTCERYCDSDAACGDGSRCIGEDNGYGSGIVGWGICDPNGCKSFGPADQCGPNGACRALTAQDGVCEYSEGTIPAYGACANPSECVAGTQCLALDAGQARCYPSCDPTRELKSARDATCPGGNLASFARFVNLAESAGPIDVYVNGTRVVRNQAPDSTQSVALARNYFNLQPGSAVIDITAANSTSNDAPLATLTAKLKGNAQTTFALTESASGLLLLNVDTPRGVAAPPAGEVSARLSLDVDLGSAVDVYVGEVGQPFFPSAVLEGVAYKDTSVFAAPIPGGTYELHLFEAGADAQTATALSVVTVDAPANSLVTVHVWGQYDGANSLSNTGATTVLYREAGMTSAGGACVELNFGPDVPSIQSGLCFQKCAGTEIGPDACVAENDSCMLFRSDFSCLPSKKKANGEACNTGDLNPCEAGSYCRGYGDGSGVCASYCDPTGIDTSLQCPSGQACDPIDGTPLGKCGFACEPNANYSSNDCSEPLLQACVEIVAGKQAFCSASGSIGVDQACTDVTVDNCVPEAVCRRAPDSYTINGVIIDPVSPGPGATDNGLCRHRCELFTDESGCPDGQACMIDATHLSTTKGFCQPADDALSGLTSLDVCPDESRGMMCGDGSVCVQDGSGSICLQFCELGTNRGCNDEQICRRLFGSGVNIGYCIPD